MAIPSAQTALPPEVDRPNVSLSQGPTGFRLWVQRTWGLWGVERSAWGSAPQEVSASSPCTLVDGAIIPNSSSTSLPPGTSLLACMAATLWELFWLCWVFVAAWAFIKLWCMGFSLQWFFLLQSKGSRARELRSCGSRALEHRPSSCGTRA